MLYFTLLSAFLYLYTLGRLYEYLGQRWSSWLLGYLIVQTAHFTRPFVLVGLEVDDSKTEVGQESL